MHEAQIVTPLSMSICYRSNLTTTWYITTAAFQISPNNKYYILEEGEKKNQGQCQHLMAFPVINYNVQVLLDQKKHVSTRSNEREKLAVELHTYTYSPVRSRITLQYMMVGHTSRGCIRPSASLLDRVSVSASIFSPELPVERCCSL